MRQNSFYFLPIILALASLTLASDDNDKYIIPFLRAEAYTPDPLTLDGLTTITSHIINSDATPVLLDVDSGSYHPRHIQVYVPKEAFDDPYKPFYDKELDLAKLYNFHISGMNIYGTRGWCPNRGKLQDDWPARDGIILLKDEGYARLISFRPGWIVDETNIPQGTDRLIVDLISPGSVHVSTPILTRDALTPGKRIVFNESNAGGLYVKGKCYVPFKRSCKKFVSDVELDREGINLYAAIEVSGFVEASKDIFVTYLIGNHGTRYAKSFWIWQNALVPAWATFEVLEGDKVIATIDGSTLRGTLDLLPERSPIPLNPGEYLTYHRVLPTATLPFKRDKTYQLRLRIDAQWLAKEPGEHDQPQVMSLLATTPLQMRKVQNLSQNELRTLVTEQDAQILKLLEKITTLQAELARACKDSSNLSKPPSSNIVKPLTPP